VDSSPAVQIVGNTVSGNGAVGIQMLGTSASQTLVAGNRIGTDAAGEAALSNGIGVFVDGAPSNLLRGNTISGNAIAGVQILAAGATANLVQGNVIGLDATGEQPLGNNFGVFIQGVDHNTIGGAAASGAGNVISGNIVAGIEITDHGAIANLVQGNFIGTDVTGMRAMLRAGAIDSAQRQNVGVLINNTDRNVVNGGNVVSGNLVGLEVAGSGQDLQSAGPPGNILQGNLVGTDATGSRPVGNEVGVDLNSSRANLLAGSVVSGNTQFGILLFGNLTTGNALQGNRIGTAADGRTAFRNPDGTFLQPIGVAIQDASNNTVGGAASGAGNVITGNEQAGVYILGHSNSAVGNLVAGNAIGLNADGSRGAGNGEYGVLLYNAAQNTVSRSGSGANRFGPVQIAQIREFTGPESFGTTRTASRPHRRTPTTPQGPRTHTRRPRSAHLAARVRGL
jgi:titin